MATAKRPTRVVLILTVLIVVGLAVAAYYVNLPIGWIIGGGALAMLALAWRLSQSKQTQPVSQSTQDTPPKS
jgi:hypothetical protein